MLLLAMMPLICCESTRTAVFDHYSYQKTTEIKIETSRLVGKAATAYAANREEIDALMLNIEKLAEYEKNKPDNQITIAMWKVLSDPEKNLLGGFIKLWKEKGTLNPVFVEESKKQILEAIDLLIQYEIKKDKDSKNKLLNLISLTK